MIVVSMTRCPPKLRGDLSKWLLEINTGVYVGQVSARVREALWKRICENIGDGQATMVFSANNEQHLDFYVHNTMWKPIDLEGIKLMKHLNNHSGTFNNESDKGMSYEMRRLINKRKRKRSEGNVYVVVDIETTGLSPEHDSIIEIAAIEVNDEGICRRYESLLKSDKPLSKEIQNLTGINDKMLQNNGAEQIDALVEFVEFICGKKILIYNAQFDMSFIKNSLRKYKINIEDSECIDVLSIAKSKLRNIENYKLETVARHLGVCKKQTHRAMEDCEILNLVYKKLNEI